MHPLKKQILALVLTVITLLQVAAVPAPAAPAGVELALGSTAAVLIDGENGTVLYEKNARTALPPASITKIMTLLLAMEDLQSGRIDWETTVTVSERAWRTGASESQMFLNIGQQVTFKDLLKGIAIVSANDACIAVAEHLNGSVEAFVQRMNRRAAELGLEQSHFVNAHGLDDPDHYMSALDIAHLASYFIRTHPEAAAFHTETEFTFNDIRQFNYNTLLQTYPGADGLKTGSTPKAGYCLASTAKRQEMRLIAVVLNASSKEQRRKDSATLLDYGFGNYELKTLHEKDAVITTVPVKRGQKREVGLIADGPVRAVVPHSDPDYGIVEEFDLPRSVSAPVEEGELIGTLKLKDPQGAPITSVELRAQESLKRLGFFANIGRRIGDLFAGLWRRVTG